MSLQRAAGNHAVTGLLTDQGLVRPATGDQPKQVQRLFSPEDVAGEMVGKRFDLAEAFTVSGKPVAVGSEVEIVEWKNDASTVRAQLPLPAADRTVFDVPKSILRATHPAAGGLAQYHTAVGDTATAMAAGQQKLDKELARPGGPRPGEVPRLEHLQKVRAHLLNQQLIQETMFNRFDGVIQQWTTYYNGKLKVAAKDPLDANLVKSLLFQESQMGTAGKYLDMGDAVRTRFNIGQAIDSSAGELLIMIREMQPALIAKHHLETIDADLASAQHELKQLSRPGHPTPAEQARYDQLKAASEGYWETFLWNYKATGKPTGLAEAVDEFFATHDPGKPNRNLDYEFWIRTTIRWVFDKRTHVKSWPEAIRAYNGSGAAAKAYRDAVVKRAADAGADADYIPKR